MKKWIAAFLAFALFLGICPAMEAGAEGSRAFQSVLDYVMRITGGMAPVEGRDLDEIFEPVGMAYGVQVMGQYEQRTIDVMEYRYIGEKPVATWRGYPYVYFLMDEDRQIMGMKAINSSHDLRDESLLAWLAIPSFIDMPYERMEDAGFIFWGKGEACPERDAVDLFALTQRVYDWYAQRFNWRGPDGYGRTQTTLITNVDRDQGDTYRDMSANWNAITSYASGQGALIRFGQVSQGGSLAAYLDVVAHEYTHAVLAGHDFPIDDDQKTTWAAIHEGYADVMAVCIDTGDWEINTIRSLKDPSGRNSISRKYLSHADDFRPGRTEAHSGATILGHAAYLMCDASGRHEGESLTRWQLAQLFFASMKYLPDMADFHDVGVALMRATREQMLVVMDAGGNTVLTEAMARRIVWALGQVGIHVTLEDGDIFYRPTPTPGPAVTPTPAPAAPFKVFLWQDLVPELGILSVDTVYDTEDRGDAELKGMLNAIVDDLDGDGEEEMLVSRFYTSHTYEGEQTLLLSLIVYENEGGRIDRRAVRTLLVPGIAEVMGLYASEIGCFLYSEEGEKRIALDTFFGANEGTVTVAVYAYDGEDFRFVGDTCHEAYGSGDTYLRYAQNEPPARHVLSGAQYRMLGDEIEDSWVTLDQYVAEEPDWAMISPETDRFLADEYAELLAFHGLKCADDYRVLRVALPEYAEGLEFKELYDSQFTRELSEIYGETEGFQMLWQILSWQPLGESLRLERRDYGGLLDGLR